MMQMKCNLLVLDAKSINTGFSNNKFFLLYVHQ